MVTAAQFDVCAVDDPAGAKSRRLAVVLQHGVLGDLTTRIVAPLLPIGERYAMDRAAIIVEILGDSYVVAIHLMGAVPVRSLSAPLASLRDHEFSLKRAVDLVFFGN